MKRLTVVCIALAFAATARAQGYQCGFESVPTRVVEEEPFTVTLSYDAPVEQTHLHCELKNTSESIVMKYEVVEVSGKGKRTFALTAPARNTESEILIAGWLGEDWRQALAPIVHTPVIRVITHAEQRRLDQMKNEAAPTLQRIGYVRSPAGNVAILDDDLPGFDRTVPHALAAALRKKRIGVTLLDANALSNTYLFNRDHFDLLILTDSCIFPAAALESLRTFAESGGDLISLGGPAFSNLLWRVGGKWCNLENLQSALADAPGRRAFLDFEHGEPSAWQRETNNVSSPATLSFISPGAKGPDVSGRCAHVVIENLTGWDTFASPPLNSPFPQRHELTCFSARGDAGTTQLSVEWREKDGSRWIAVVPLTRKWKRYALPPSAFHFWQDSSSKGRGGPGDRFKPENAARIIFGLAFTHTDLVGPGKHEFFIDDVATAPMPAEAAEAEAALQETSSLPVIEGISPTYKLYPVTSLKRLQANPQQALWQLNDLPQPASTLSPYARPQGAGFGKDRRFRWAPLVDAINSEGKVAGAAAALIINGKKPGEGGLWLTMPVTDRTFFDKPQVVNAIAEAAERMLDGVFFYEGGSRYFAYVDGEEVDLGAEVANFGRRSASVEVDIVVKQPRARAPVFQKRMPLTVGPGKREKVQVTWSPGRFSGQDYVVTVKLMRAGKTIDLLQHPLSVWRPSKSPTFMTTRDGNFYLGEHKWNPHGVNYMPSSGIGIEDGEYFEFWLDPQPYDPDIIERDLSDLQAIGLNMVSVFIYYRSVDSHNLLDLLLRCQRHGLKVNLSLRPGTPLDFRWDEMRELILKNHVPENDTVFAYDLAWEPAFGGYDARKRWDPEWEKWVVSHYGSIEAAEKAWGYAAPRSTEKITGPSDAQVSRDGPWTKMAAAYRRFVDDLLHEKYGEARRLVRSVDPHHLVSFRMSAAGDPTCGQEWMPYDFKGLSGAVDIICPEGYGRIGDWERVKEGWFTVAYSRCVAPETPVMWAEFGYSVWDNNRMQDSEEGLKFEADFYRNFYDMVLRSGANGTVCWWFPGGYRCGERSDFGILNPDRSWRPVTHVIHEYAPRLTAERERPKPDVWIPINRDAHSNGLRGVYEDAKEAFWKAVAEGRTPGLKWVGTER